MRNIHGFGRASLGRYILFTLALLFSPFAHAACPADTATSFVVPAGATQLELIGVSLPPPGGSSALKLPPLHGELTQALNGTYIYAPADSFWSLRQDRFVLHHFEPGSSKPIAKTVRLMADIQAVVVTSQGFENPSSLDPWVLAGAPQIQTSSRLSGALGLRALGDVFAHTDQYVYNQAPGLSQIAGEGGGGVPGSGASGHFRDIDLPCVSGCDYNSFTTFIGLQDRFGPANLIVWGEMRKDSSGLAVRLSTSDSDPNRPWAAISDEPHRAELLVWPPAASGGAGTAMLWIDGKKVDELQSPLLTSPDVLTRTVVFGARDTTGTSSASLDWDNVAALDLAPFAAPPLEDCADGFDVAPIDPSWTIHNTVTLGTVENALVGKRSAEFTPDQPGSPVGSLLITNGLAAQNIRRLGLRFVFNPAGLDMAVGSTVVIADSANTLATRPFRVFIDRVASGNLRLRVAARHDNPALPAVVASFPLTAETHTLELDWWRSQTDVQGTGYLRVWLDGEEKANLTGLLNPNQITHEVRFGAATVAGAPSGKLVMDALDLWYE